MDWVPKSGGHFSQGLESIGHKLGGRTLSSSGNESPEELIEKEGVLASQFGIFMIFSALLVG